MPTAATTTARRAIITAIAVTRLAPLKPKLAVQWALALGPFEIAPLPELPEPHQ
jgi:hypothetical protein